ncbi:helix-turn-helix domain-containing protein [Sphingobium sp. AP49]|uniref:helix-turn-helix domain-containing protein n=1 Tax=Sphingobium sp. AP49 TaxID=1144307 RepID=UPI00026EDD12|nr:helix-turn-helix domain-containing protein [Sphingobium sp. AP49]WHO39878.1 helix-turn-helix domain-containing protein [Sphingobium sp. AP49]
MTGSRLSNGAYREAVATIVRRVQKRHGLSDSQLADRIGCSAGTVKNARNQASNLDAVTLASIEQVFGPGAIDPYLALAEVRAVPLTPPVSVERLHPTLAIVEALHRIIETQMPDSEGGTRITSHELLAILTELREARGVFDALIMIADPALDSGERRFRDKGRKRLAVVHTQGGQVTRADIVHTDDEED